jgi:hypothetical protein
VSDKRPNGEVLAEYRLKFPILDAYRAIIEKHNAHDGPITEPPASVGLDCLTAVEMALTELGRPADRLSAQMALAFVRQLEAEIASLSIAEAQTIESAVMDCFFPYSGSIPDLEAWEEMSADVQRFMVDDEWIAGLDDEVLREILVLAMPMLLLRTIGWDQRRRNRLTVVPPSEAP